MASGRPGGPGRLPRLLCKALIQGHAFRWESVFFFCENLAGGWLATRGYGLFKKVCEKSYSMIIYRNRVMIIMYWVPLMNHYIDNVVNRYADLAGVHRIQAKELRTTHACLLINKYNVDILAVSQRLDHAKPTTTLKYYSQLWRGRNRTVADQLNGAIGKIEHPDHSLVDFNGNQFVAL